MLDLKTAIPLKRSWSYSSPRNQAGVLPLVYGDMTEAEQGGLWQAVCVDTDSFVYALAGHPLHGSVSLYDKAGESISSSDYTLNLAHNFEGGGVIATAVFSGDAVDKEPITVRAAGKPDGSGNLIENPFAIAVDLLVDVCGAEVSEIEPFSLSRAISRADELGYSAAGVINSGSDAASVLTEIIGAFLGSWWRAADGRIKLSADQGTGAVSEAELAAHFRESDLKGVSVAARLDNLVNRAEVLYRVGPMGGEYAQGLDGDNSRDLASIGLYGQRTRELELRWVRSSQVASTIASRLVAMLGSVRRVITLQDTSLANIHLERGDAALLSLSWLADEAGLPLVNQIVRVLSIEPQLDKGVIDFTCMDTGYFLTKAYLADGSWDAGGSTQAGGERDRRML